MIFHTHKENPALVRGSPDPEDQADEIAVVVSDASGPSLWYAFPPNASRPLIRILRRAEGGGRAHADCNRPA